MRQGEMLYTEISVHRVWYEPSGTYGGFIEGLRAMYLSDVKRPSSISRLMAATDGDGGKDPCRRAVNRLAQNPSLQISIRTRPAICHHWTTNMGP